jgi:hypothetical protein
VFASGNDELWLILGDAESSGGLGFGRDLDSVTEFDTFDDF